MGDVGSTAGVSEDETTAGHRRVLLQLNEALRAMLRSPRGNTAFIHLLPTTIIMSQYPIPPPSYGSTSPSPKSPNPQVYSGGPYHDEPGSSAGIHNQPAPGDLPDDFKVGSLLSTRLMPSLTL